MPFYRKRRGKPGGWAARPECRVAYTYSRKRAQTYPTRTAAEAALIWGHEDVEELKR